MDSAKFVSGLTNGDSAKFVSVTQHDGPSCCLGSDFSWAFTLGLLLVNAATFISVKKSPLHPSPSHPNPDEI